MDQLSVCLVFGGVVALVFLYIVSKIKGGKAADAELQRTNPELWRHKEILKLEKERLSLEMKQLAAQKEIAQGRLAAEKKLAEEQMATQRHLAEQQARQENLRQSVGVCFAIGRGLGWW